MSLRDDFDQIDVEEDQQQTDSRYPAALQPLFDDGYLLDVLGVVKSGKEATVYRCRANVGRTGGHEMVAAKVYKQRTHRGFKDDSVYQEGRVILDRRLARAVHA